jgi:3-dehydroquinate dehydratase / shikimate dehydrogenase
MSEPKTILIATVPPEYERHEHLTRLPADGCLWGHTYGNPVLAWENIQQLGLPFWKVIYSLQKTGADAENPLPLEVRLLFYEQAIAMFDYVELQFGRDTDSETLDCVPPGHRMIKAEAGVSNLENLDALFQQMARIEAQFYTITVQALHSGDELPILALLKKLGRNDVIAFADGPLGAWTRLVAPAFGSPAVYTSLAEHPSASGELPIKSLMEDYGFPEIPRFEHLNGIAGNPVFRSLSPKLHNAAYRELGIASFFVPFHLDDYETFHRCVVKSPMLAELGFDIQGLTVVSPFKEVGYQVADRVLHPISRLTASSNLLTKHGAEWVADSTDPLAILEALKRLQVLPRQLRAAVIGCGGAGRAIAATLMRVGAQVVLFNRTPVRGKIASKQLNIPFQLLHELDPAIFDILVNATPLGKQAHERPFNPDTLRIGAVFIDYAYGKQTTQVIQDLRERGVGCVDGREVLIIQVRRQFEAMTGESMPEELAKQQVFKAHAEHILT